MVFKIRNIKVFKLELPYACLLVKNEIDFKKSEVLSKNFLNDQLMKYCTIRVKRMKSGMTEEGGMV